MAPPPPELIDDVVAEILLRLPPDKPENLFRASLVCKTWLRVLTDPNFHCRYRPFHRTPPLLGFLRRRDVKELPPAPLLTTTTAAPLSPNPSSFGYSEALDCRHGRVLLDVEDFDIGCVFFVWDPLTGEKQRLPVVQTDRAVYSAAVFCAVSGCDHLDCHGGPFRVVFMATGPTSSPLSDNELHAAVYSSETGAWSTPVSLANGPEVYVHPRQGAVIGDEIFFTLEQTNEIVKYDCSKDCISIIKPPSHDAYFVALMKMGDSALGFACIEGSSLYLWSREVRSEGATGWMQCKVVDIGAAIPGANCVDEACVVGSAEGLDLIFVVTRLGLFTFELKSGKVVKIHDVGDYFSILPYTSFYTHGSGTLSSLARRVLADP